MIRISGSGDRHRRTVCGAELRYAAITGPSRRRNRCVRELVPGSAGPWVDRTSAAGLWRPRDSLAVTR